MADLHDTDSYELDDEPLQLRAWAEWPTCPICAQRRQARCATCGFTGDRFPLADYQEFGVEARLPNGVALGRAGETSQHARLLLMCPVCDEAFRPRFYHRCAACGHDFGEGVRVETSDYEELSARILWATAGVCGVLFAILCYLWLILRP